MVHHWTIPVDPVRGPHHGPRAIPGTVLDVVAIVTLIVTLVRRYVLSPPCLSMSESLNSC